MDAPAGSPWDIEHTFSLQAGSLGEGWFEMAMGSSISVQLEATHTLEWDIHSHDAAGVPITHVSGRDSMAEHDFTAPYDGSFFTLWSNTLADATQVTVSVKIAMDGNVTFVRWR